MYFSVLQVISIKVPRPDIAELAINGIQDKIKKNSALSVLQSLQNVGTARIYAHSGSKGALVAESENVHFQDNPLNHILSFKS